MTNDKLIDLLQSHRLSYTFEEDGETGLSLLDRLTPEHDSDVSRGRDEIQFLAEEIELFQQAEHTRAWNEAIDVAINEFDRGSWSAEQIVIRLKTLKR